MTYAPASLMVNPFTVAGTSRTIRTVFEYELGTALVDASRTCEGIQHLRQAVAVGEGIVRASPGATYMANQLAAAKADLGAALIAADSHSAEGCRLVNDGLALSARASAGAQAPANVAAARPRFERILAGCAGR